MPSTNTQNLPLLEVENLSVSFNRHGQSLNIVRDISFTLNKGERAALVGESGCGKSITSLSLSQLPPTHTASITGTIKFDGEIAPHGLKPHLGKDVAYVFQDPLSCLNPVLRIGDQLCEAIKYSDTTTRLSSKQQMQQAFQLLEQVDLKPTEGIAKSYPCELSGGMCQRVMIAMALASKPKLLIADEPTTALDVTTQKEVLDLVDALVKSHNMSLLISTHNLGIVAGRCDTVHVLYTGEIVESGSIQDVLYSPKHPYTQGLLNAVPRIEDGRKNQLIDIPGSVPSLDNLPSGCLFAPRCTHATPQCITSRIPLKSLANNHRYRCNL